MILFPDTNILIHFQPIENWDWKSELGNIQIGLCLSIINELDKTKYSVSSNNTKRRVQGLVKKISSSSTLIFNHIPFIIYMPEGLQEILKSFHLDMNDKDDVFIASVLQYMHVNPQDDVQIISNDLGVQLKCKAHRIKFLIPDEKYLINEEDSAEKEIKKLTVELNRIKNLQPKLRLQFDNGETQKAFDIKEPWKEYEDEIIETLEAIRAANPFLEPDLETNQERFQLFDLYKKTPDKVARYNEALQEYYSDYELYLKKNKVYAYKEKLTVILKIELSNFGNTPAEDIDLYMHFPDGFRLGEKDDYYAKEREPSPPDLSSYSMAPIDFSTLIPSLMTSHLSNINLGRFSIKKTNSYEVKDYFKNIKHNHIGRVNPLYVTFDRFEDAKNFEITYKITAGNMVDIEENSLHVIINKIEDFDSEEENGS